MTRYKSRSRRTLLIVGGGRLQVPAYVTGRRLGLRVVGVDRDRWAPAGVFADRLEPIDTHDVASIVELARAERIAGVVTLCTDLPVRAVAAASDALGLSGVTIESANLATHKGRMREAFARAGAPNPRFRLVRSLAEADAAARELGLPVIVKPPSASGSRGVFKVDAMHRLRDAFDHARKSARDEEVLVEEFIDGPEVSVETLSFDGGHHIIAITDKSTTGDPFWVETGHVEPSRLSAAMQDSLRSATLAGLRALAITNSAAHVELKIARDGTARIIEIGARLGGDFITTELVPRSSGVDMVEGIIRIALGEAPDVERKSTKGAAIRYVEAPPGIVEEVVGMAEASAMPGIVRLELDVSPGDAVAELRSSMDRPGFAIAVGSDASEAADRARAAAARVIVRTRPSAAR